jgi:hypothetical protein
MGSTIHGSRGTSEVLESKLIPKPFGVQAAHPGLFRLPSDIIPNFIFCVYLLQLKSYISLQSFQLTFPIYRA